VREAVSEMSDAEVGSIESVSKPDSRPFVDRIDFTRIR